MPVEARFSAPVQTELGVHSAAIKWVKDLFHGGKAATAWR
jgi:hypothetical protein